MAAVAHEEPPYLEHEGGVLICRECSLYPRCYGYATSADPETSGPDQMLDHLMRHPGYLAAGA